MKLTRMKLRNIVESILKEQERGLTGDFSPRIAKQAGHKIDDMVSKLQTAMYGLGHDMTMTGKANKYLTGLGTNEDDIKEVFRDIVDFAASEDAEHLHKSPIGRGKKLLMPIGVLEYVNLKFKKFNDISLGQALIDELGKDSEDMLELEEILSNSDFLKHIT